MKFGLIVFSFFIFSLLLVYLSIKQNIQRIHTKQINKVQVNKIQPISTKGYTRTRKEYVPNRSFSLANQRIKNILLENSILGKAILIDIVKIVNHVKEDVALSILTYTDVDGKVKYNLSLSQKRADRLKKYFVNKTDLPLIVAIGYGEAFSLKNRSIEIKLKRIKQ